jgi:transposase
MDNLASHKHPSILKAIHEAGGSVIFTPPYSPEFNPIEEAWAKLKDILRRAETTTRDAFDSALKSALDAIRESDISGWVRFAGYRLTST